MKKIIALCLALWLLPAGALAGRLEVTQETPAITRAPGGEAATQEDEGAALAPPEAPDEGAQGGEIPEKIQRFIEVARAEFEANDWKKLPKDNKYTVWYYGDHRQIGWCSVFLIWCANEAGIPLFKKDAVEMPDDGVFSCIEGRVGNVKLGFESVGRWTETEPPKPGYLIVYGVRGSTPYTHIAMVESVTEIGEGVYELTTLEGNINSTVKRYRYRYDLTPKKAYHNMSVVPEGERSDENCQYKLHNEKWYVFGFCKTWE